MTTQYLETHVSVRWCGFGCYKVIVHFRGVFYYCVSHNSLAFYRINSDKPANSCHCSYTFKQALKSFYDECLFLNRVSY